VVAKYHKNGSTKYADINHTKLAMTGFETAQALPQAHKSCNGGYFNFPNDILTSGISCYND